MSWKPSVEITGIKISKCETDSERIATFTDGYQIIVSRGWVRNGGKGWICSDVYHTEKSIRRAAIAGRRARDRRESGLAGCAVGPISRS